MRNKTIYSCLAIGLVLLFVFSFTGCRQPQPDIEIIPEPPSGPEELDISDKEFESYPDVVTIYFEFDKFDLSDDAREKLGSNADFVKEHPEASLA